MGSSILVDRMEASVRKRLLEAGWDVGLAGEAETQAICRAYAVGIWERPRRGVLLSGGVGCGKTMAVKAVHLVGRTDHAHLYRLFSDSAVENLEHFEAGEFWKGPDGVVILDDVGAEPEIRYRKKDFVGDFIMKFHDLWTRGAVGRLSVTTNLSGEEMAVRYGARVMSRLLEMVVPVRMTGGDRRKRVVTSF